LTQSVLVTGAGGQLGRELLADSESGFVGVSRSQLDIGDAAAVSSLLREVKPRLVINAAAYTAVDQAESEPESADRVNALGPENLALACRELNARLIHISTDFVFDGQASAPYSPDHPPSPVGSYGRGKLEGEQAVQSILPGALIIRTGWLYSRHGSNFVKTMLRLMGERDELAVVADQTGTPTWAKGLADAIWAFSAREDLEGIYHWSDAGECSWYDFAVAICEEACDIGLLPSPIKIQPIAGVDYPTPARRPAYSVLNKDKSWRDLGLEGVPWRAQLQSMLLQLKEHKND
jgi:dTDP-4-dehydrorhamnose reductase